MRQSILWILLIAMATVLVLLFSMESFWSDDVQPALSPNIVSSQIPWGMLEGCVIDAEGEPVAGATVIVQSASSLGAMATADGEGCYSIDLGLSEAGSPERRGRPAPRGALPAQDVTVMVTAEAPGFCASTRPTFLACRGKNHEVPTIRLWRGGYIHGRVLDPSDLEVTAEVWCDGLEQQQGTVSPVAPSEGESVRSQPGTGFTLGPFAPGMVSIHAGAFGVGGGSQDVPVGEGETTETTLVLSIPARLAGRVVDANGAPVVGIAVVCRPDKPAERDSTVPAAGREEAESRVEARSIPVERPSPQRAKEQSERMAKRRAQVERTDAEGRFAFFGLRENEAYSVHVADVPVGHLGAAVNAMRPSRDDLRLEIPTQHQVRGRVVDARTEEPVSGCALQWMREELAEASHFRLTIGLESSSKAPVTSDERGEFSLPGLFSGRYRLLALAPGHEVGTVEFHCVEHSPDPSPLIRLDPAASVEGLVRDEEGRPIAGAELRCRARAWKEQRADLKIEWLGTVRATSDAKGHFIAEGLPAGVELTLTARGGEGRAGRQDLRLRQGERRHLELSLAPASSLTVQLVHPRGWTLPGFPVFVRSLDDPEVDLGVTTGSDSSVRIEDLPPGQYEVRAVHPKENTMLPEVKARIRQVTIRRGKDEAIELPGSDLASVTIEVRESSRPIGLARVGFGPRDGTPDHFEPLLFDAELGIVSALVPPGQYHLSISTPGMRYEVDEPLEVAGKVRASITVSRKSPASTSNPRARSATLQIRSSTSTRRGG